MKYALLVVGPACFLNGATAALSFIALTFSDSALIQTFGIAGAICMGITFLAVITVLPLIAIFVLSKDAEVAARLANQDGAMALLRRFCGWAAGGVTRRPLAFAGLGLGLVVGFGVAHLTLEPRYRLADQVPDREQAVKAAGRLDMKLTGANPIDVMIELPPGETVYSEGPLRVIAEVHRVVERQAGVGNVWSVETMVRWLAETGQTDIFTLKAYTGLLPAHLTTRFVTARAGRRARHRPHPRHRRLRPAAHRQQARQGARHRPLLSPRLHHLRQRPRRHRRPQQRRHDPQDQPDADRGNGGRSRP